MNKRLGWMVSLLFLLLLTGCLPFGQPQTLGHEAILEGEATLSCNQTCSDRGQCGVDPATGENLVLANIGAPTVQNHTLTLNDNTSVILRQHVDQNVMRMSSGEIYSTRFYEVANAEQTFVAWVAGWCVAQ